MVELTDNMKNGLMNGSVKNNFVGEGVICLELNSFFDSIFCLIFFSIRNSLVRIFFFFSLKDFTKF